MKFESKHSFTNQYRDITDRIMKSKTILTIALIMTSIMNGQTQDDVNIDFKYIFKIYPKINIADSFVETIKTSLKRESIIGEQVKYKNTILFRSDKNLFKTIDWDGKSKEYMEWVEKQYCPKIIIELSDKEESVLIKNEERFFYCSKNHDNDYFKSNPEKARGEYLKIVNGHGDRIHCPICNANYSPMDMNLLVEREEIKTRNIIRFYNVDGEIRDAKMLCELLKQLTGVEFMTAFEFDHLIDDLTN